MNTIPTTSKNMRIPYTVVGGRRKDKSHPDIALLLLNRGGRLFRAELFQELEHLPVAEVLSVQGPSYDVENLAKRFPKVKFLLLHEEASRGEQINIAMDESSAPYVFVIWNDMHISPGSLSEKLTSRMETEGLLCAVPLMQNQKLQTVPSIQAPAFHGNKLKMVPLQPKADGMVSLFPFDYTGLYSRERFLLLGGFDHTLTSSYWQKMDFGFRAFMWGELIRVFTTLRVSYQQEVPTEDTTVDESYRYFFLKNLGVRFSGDKGELPWKRFLSFVARGGGGLFQAFQEFKKTRAWVETNQYRFRQDARSVTDLWEIPE